MSLVKFESYCHINKKILSQQLKIYSQAIMRFKSDESLFMCERLDRGMAYCVSKQCWL